MDSFENYRTKLTDNTGGLITDESLRQEFDETTIKQVWRVQRQRTRTTRAVDVMNNDKGIDPVSGGDIMVSTPTATTATYHKELNELYKKLKEKSCAYTLIDTCVHIGIYRDEGYGFV
jgi:hypothetical protein